MTKISQAVLQQAADWYAILLDEQCTAQQQQAHQQWLLLDETHQRAWQQIELISQQFSTLTTGDAQQKKLIAHTLAQSSNLSRRQLLTFAALGVFSGSIVYVERQSIYQSLLRVRADASTDFAQQKHLSLTTGLNIWLNSQTAIQYQDGWIKLFMGEMIVQVANNVTAQIAHQFGQIIIHSGRFCIRQFETHSLIGVLSGKITLKTSFGSVVKLEAGQQIDVSHQRFSPIKRLQSYQWSWSKGVLAADNMSLRQWAAEMQRYHHGSIICSEQAAQLHIVGVFPLHDFDKALGMLKQTLPVQVKKRFGYWVSIDLI